MINRLIDVARKNRFVVVVVYLGLAGWGWWALTSTPIDAIPDLSGNQVIVFTDWLLHVLVVTLVIFLWIRERRLGLQREPPPRHQVMSLSARRIPGNDDRAEQLLHGIDDVTARADRTAGLVAKGERKDQLIAMLGHELRHPLTPITHAIYLLRKSHQDPATIELLDTIDTQTQTLVRFVNELLDLSRISHGLIEIRPERLDLGAVARDAVHALQPFIEERQHVVSLVLLAAPLYVRGDPGRLRQVVSNLVENAAKYTEPGGRITVTLEQRGDEAVLAVRDNGIGIDAENLERIFEPFTQSHQPLASPSSGLGIGLSVSRRIVELHGGHVKVTSAGSCAGSEFVVSLPVSAADTRDNRGSENVGKASAPFVPLHARRVMIVDDHEEIRSLHRASCTRLGSRDRRRRRRLECALAGGSIPARARHRGSLNAWDERDRPGSSSASAVSSHAAPPDRSQCLRRRRHPRRVPRRRFRCVSGQARRDRRVGGTARTRHAD